MIEIIALILINLILFYKTIDLGLICEDHHRYEAIRQGHLDPTKNRGVAWWIMLARYCYGAGTFGLNTRLDHAVTLATHITICCLIYWAFGLNQISFCSALLYSCNPANNQVSIWLNGRRYALNIIIVLLMVGLGTTGLVLWPLTALLQESALFAPIMYGPLGAGLIAICLPIFLPHALKKYADRMDKCKSPDIRNWSWRRLIVVIKLYGFYLTKMIWPGRCMMFYPELAFWGLTKAGNDEAYKIDWKFSRGAVLMILSVVGIGFAGQYQWMALFTFLATLQWCGFAPGVQTPADRYIALPNVFVAFFFASLCHLVLGQYALIPIAFLIGNYMVNLQLVCNMYRNLHGYHVYFTPQNVNMRSAKIIEHFKNNDPISAVNEVRDGLNQSPADFMLLYHGAQAWCMMGVPEIAEKLLSEAEKNMYIGQEDVMTEAIREFRIKLSPPVNRIKNVVSG